MALAIAGWCAVVASAPLVYGFETLTVFGNNASVGRAIDQSPVRLIDAGRGFVIVSSSEAKATFALYKAGAWLVLPGDLSACIRLP